MGCVHRCTSCYVRAFERRADRPADHRYGTSIRGKVNVAGAAPRARAPLVAGRPRCTGAATDPYQPAEGRYRLTRACIEALRRGGEPVLDHHARPDGRARDVDARSSTQRGAPTSRR
jgi:DNA repair photolyase